jgi:uncharacterized repeat protein (TIGR01451 family)
MIGRIDSTSDRWRARVGRPAALVAIAAFIAFSGASTTSLAQTQPQPQSGPRGKIEGVIPSEGTQVPAEPSAPPALPQPEQLPGGLPDIGSPPSSSQPPALPVAPPMGSGGMSFPGSSSDEPAAPIDKKVKRVEAAEPDDKDKGPLPTAIQPDGTAPSPDKGASGSSPGPFFLDPNRMSPGKQRVQLTVEVQASPIINLNKETTVRLVVNNESNVDASGVSLVYQLPESLKLNSSLPEATQVPGKPQYQWSRPMLPAGGEWVVVLKVVAISTKAAEHAATVTVKTGSKANSTIQEPKLKVEATCSPGRVLKGEQINFRIAVQNPGTGPARNVIVQAKLSSGLKSGSDDIVEQTIPELLPGQRVELDVLTVDTVAGGEQSCTVDVRSSDVIPVPEDQRIIRTVDVTKPELTVKLEAQNFRFTGQNNEYKLTVKNTGTAPAKRVKVIASLPQQGGKLLELPKGAKFDLPTRKLLWLIPQIEPDQPYEMTFNYGTSTPGLYRASLEATSGELHATDTMTTEVTGIAVLDLQISQPPTSRIIDVGNTNYYDIKITNVGTKEATKLGLKGTLTTNLKVVKTFNVEKGEFVFNPKTGEFIFPTIERLGVGQSKTLSLEVQATTSGPAGCKVSLGHSEMAEGDPPVEDVISTTITGNSRPKTSPKP